MEALLDGLNDQQAGTPELVSAEDLLGAEVAAELEAAYRMDQVLTAGGGIAAMLPERVVVQ